MFIEFPLYLTLSGFKYKLMELSSYRNWILVWLFLFIVTTVNAKTGRYRCMWRDDPATTMVIGWDQISGINPVVYYDTKDQGRNVSAYKSSKRPLRPIQAKGMSNHFVRLTNLKPNTVYYFIIKDSDSVSRRFSFKTMPNTPDQRLSIIAGGDSRNHRDARQNANRIVSKLRPHFIMFGGDMTGGDTGKEWRAWFDDWQLTFGGDGRIFPIVPARGNHESSNKSIVDLFDVSNPDIYYSLTFGGNLLKVYTLNTLIPSGGNQKLWLEKDLRTSGNITWKFAHYHHTIRPHTRSKPERDELLLNWATFFYKYRLNLVVESDAHVVKWTYPIKPSRAPGSKQGFIRDDANGTVYIGEGCWGAPLRKNNDDKPWTRNSASFNQFKWIFADQYKVEIRTVQIDKSTRVEEVDQYNPYVLPPGLSIWRPSNGAVVTIKNKNAPPPPKEEPILAAREAMEVIDFEGEQKGPDISLSWSTINEFNILTFEIQRSLDGGKNYTAVEQIKSKGGNGKNTYRYLDRGIPSSRMRNLSYRLKCVSKNGKSTFFNSSFAANRQIDWAALPKVMIDPKTGFIRVKYYLKKVSNVTILLLNPKLKEVARIPFPKQSAGPYMKALDMKKVPKGRYLVIVKANQKVVQRYKVLKS